MTPLRFLQAVWPESGNYCLVKPYAPPLSGYKHIPFTSIDAAAKAAASWCANEDVFFCIHTLVDLTRTKINDKGKEVPSIRVQSNVKEAKCFFFDIDVGEGKPYATQGEALGALKNFIAVTKLPWPMVTSSGGGLHVYWLLETPIASADWKSHAEKLKRLAHHYGLGIDNARTTDTVSVLRVAGTFNHKRGEKREVKVVVEQGPSPNEPFLTTLKDAVTAANLTVTPHLARIRVPESDILGDNTTLGYTGPAVTMPMLMTSCPLMAHYVRNAAKADNNSWYFSLGVLAWLEDGETVSHQVSGMHPDYSFDETQGKIDQQLNSTTGVTGCRKMQDVVGEERCNGCAFKAAGSNPLTVTTKKIELPNTPAPAPAPPMGAYLAPALQQALPPVATILPPPYPYKRSIRGIMMERPPKDDGKGPPPPVCILDHDLYIVRRANSWEAGSAQTVWCVTRPHHAPQEFMVDAAAFGDDRKLGEILRGRDIWPDVSMISEVRKFMNAYVQELQRNAPSDNQHEYLGWSDDKTQFTLPSGTICEDGSVLPVTIGNALLNAQACMTTAGSADKQRELLDFFNHDEYINSQFVIMCGLGAPIFYVTDHAGAIVNAVGETGAGKSTALFAAASWYGNPSKYVLNGTKGGATQMARAERVTRWANMPIGLDEVTHINEEEARTMAMGISQSGSRVRCDRDGNEKPVADHQKSTLLLCTSNHSIHSILAQNNQAGTAGSMRVIEIGFVEQTIHTKAQGDDLLRDLYRNYGHFGVDFLKWVVRNRADVEKLLIAKQREIDTLVSARGAERFWTAACATAIVACMIANSLKLVKYDPRKMQHWVVHHLFPRLRGVVKNEYMSDVDALTEFMMSHIDETIVAENFSHHGDKCNITETPKRRASMRQILDVKTMIVAKDAFRSWCVKRGFTATSVIDKLAAQGVITNKHHRVELTKGTNLAPGRPWCFSVQLDHPAIAEKVEPVAKPAPKTVPSKPNLRVV